MASPSTPVTVPPSTRSRWCECALSRIQSSSWWMPPDAPTPFGAGFRGGRACVDGPLGARGETREFCFGAVAVVCPACLLRRVPLAQMGSAIHSQTEERPCWPPPYTGSVDRRTDRSASFPSSPAPAADERSGGGRPGPVDVAARHHGPYDPGHLVGQSHRGELARLAAQQVEQPLRGGWAPRWPLARGLDPRVGMLDDRGRPE